jgi:hypothetical protein
MGLKEEHAELTGWRFDTEDSTPKRCLRVCSESLVLILKVDECSRRALIQPTFFGDARNRREE